MLGHCGVPMKTGRRCTNFQSPESEFAFKGLEPGYVVVCCAKQLVSY
jgi:hypothetical protein